MSTSELMLFFAIAIVGFISLRWANRFGKEQKFKFEDEARDRITQSLSKLAADKNQYRFYTFDGKQWKRSNYTNMINEIINDCVRSAPDGPSYGRARYSLTTDSNSKVLYYVVGTNTHKFTKLPDVHS